MTRLSASLNVGFPLLPDIRVCDRTVTLGTSMLDLVESLFTRYGVQSLRYDGSMGREAREAVLSRFRKPGGPKVILIRYTFLV